MRCTLFYLKGVEDPLSAAVQPRSEQTRRRCFAIANIREFVSPLVRIFFSGENFVREFREKKKKKKTGEKRIEKIGDRWIDPTTNTHVDGFVCSSLAPSTLFGVTIARSDVARVETIDR